MEGLRAHLKEMKVQFEVLQDLKAEPAFQGDAVQCKKVKQAFRQFGAGALFNELVASQTQQQKTAELQDVK